MRFWIFFLPALLAAQTMQHDMSHMDMDHDMSHMDMSTEAHAAFGTSWNPASSPMNMRHFEWHRWKFALHGIAFIGDIQETGPRGEDKFVSMNWVMGEAKHSFGKGELTVRSMLSLDPATITHERYPELFQTGETAYGKPIIDGQHPHDFFMELSVKYSHPLSKSVEGYIYFAPVGDPALGPVGFPHRVSASELPQATLGHHLQDSTHVSNEVFTVGVKTKLYGLEASGFHGAEPNENRWNIDRGSPDSFSARAFFTPSANWSAQVSAGRLTHPEALEAGDQTRVIASVTYNRPLTNGNWASSLLWGRVHKTSNHDDLQGYGLESVLRFASKNYVTGRVELVDKDELFADGAPYSGRKFRIGAFTAGYTRDFFFLPGLATGLGANLTWYAKPGDLDAAYGKHPTAAMVFLRFKLREMHH